jgi:hypothetical protein
MKEDTEIADLQHMEGHSERNRFNTFGWFGWVVISLAYLVAKRRRLRQKRKLKNTFTT